MKKILIIRLSSLGDILQCLPAVDLLKQQWPQSEIHWWVKQEFASTLKVCQSIDCIHSFDKKQGLWHFLKTSWQLRRENYTHIYDAHSNLRSHLAAWILRWPPSPSRFIRRSKQRFQRWLLFTLRYNLLPQPFKAANSFTKPLQAWGINDSHWPKPSAKIETSPIIKQLIQDNLVPTNFIMLAPSAAWELKRWPIEHWQKLIELNDQKHFVVVGGPQDDFCQKLVGIAPQRVHNFAGQLNWQQTFEMVHIATAVVSGDTGVLHMADYLHKTTVALIGPTAFGFPSNPSTQTLEVSLDCRPCSKDGRGRCHNSVYKKCLVEITPQRVSRTLDEALAHH